MKLVIAIVHDEDGNNCLRGLGEKGFSVTKLASTGGFLRAGNTTLFIGTDEDKVQDVINIVKETSESRKQIVTTPYTPGGNGAMTPYPMEVEVGGAAIFVVDIERFLKI